VHSSGKDRDLESKAGFWLWLQVKYRALPVFRLLAHLRGSRQGRRLGVGRRYCLDHSHAMTADAYSRGRMVIRAQRRKQARLAARGRSRIK
jgi:hypothetical protein